MPWQTEKPGSGNRGAERLPGKRTQITETTGRNQPAYLLRKSRCAFISVRAGAIVLASPTARGIAELFGIEWLKEKALQQGGTWPTPLRSAMEPRSTARIGETKAGHRYTYVDVTEQAAREAMKKTGMAGGCAPGTERPHSAGPRRNSHKWRPAGPGPPAAHDARVGLPPQNGTRHSARGLASGCGPRVARSIIRRYAQHKIF